MNRDQIFEILSHAYAARSLPEAKAHIEDALRALDAQTAGPKTPQGGTDLSRVRSALRRTTDSLAAAHEGIRKRLGYTDPALPALATDNTPGAEEP